MDNLQLARQLGLFEPLGAKAGRAVGVLGKLRQLAGPGPREKFQWEKQLAGYKVALGHIENMISNRHIDDASKEWAHQLLETMYAHAAPELRPAIAALDGARYHHHSPGDERTA